MSRAVSAYVEGSFDLHRGQSRPTSKTSRAVSTYVEGSLELAEGSFELAEGSLGSRRAVSSARLGILTILERSTRQHIEPDWAVSILDGAVSILDGRSRPKQVEVGSRGSLQLRKTSLDLDGHPIEGQSRPDRPAARRTSIDPDGRPIGGLRST